MFYCPAKFQNTFIVQPKSRKTFIVQPNSRTPLFCSQIPEHLYCPAKMQNTFIVQPNSRTYVLVPVKFQDGCFTSSQSQGYHFRSSQILFVPNICRGQSFQTLNLSRTVFYCFQVPTMETKTPSHTNHTFTHRHMMHTHLPCALIISISEHMSTLPPKTIPRRCKIRWVIV